MANILLSNTSNALLGNFAWDPLLNETIDNMPIIEINKPLFINFFADGMYTDALTVNGSVNIMLDATINGNLLTTNISTTNISATGTVTGTCFGSTSDRNLKEDIKPIHSDIVIDNILIYSYRYKENPLLFYGVMAQDLMTDESFSHLVSFNSTNKHYTVDYNQFIPVLIKETQSMKKRINTLEKCLLGCSLISLAITLLSLKR